MHERCGHCMRAEKVLEQEIASGEIKVFDAHVAQHHHHNPEGFPFFVNSVTGQSQTGWPGSKEKLYEALGVSVGAQGATAGVGGGSNTGGGSNPGGSNTGGVLVVGCGIKEGFHEPQMCSHNRRGYVTLSQTWTNKKEYSA